MKLCVLSDERFSCASCTYCCRTWHVELMPGEADRVRALAWPGGDPLAGASVILEHGGKSYLARRADGACLFLNESNGLCRIHEQFGVAHKPLGCRVFPFQIAPTFENEATVIGRFDCPTVRKNHGAAHTDELANLRSLADQMGAPTAFDEATRCHLDRDQIQAVTEFVVTLMPAFNTNVQRTLFITYLADALTLTAADQLDRSALASAFVVLKDQVNAAASAKYKRPNLFTRMAFRTLLGLYMRRDEDVLNRRAGRIGRVLGLFRILLGFGGFRSLGLSHRPGSIRRAWLFKPGLESSDPETFALFWRMIRNRLESFQFMGPANSNRDFLAGLRTLGLLYPLVVAVAKYSAGNRGSSKLESPDVEFAVEAIEHSYGRLAILKQPFVRTIETFLLDRNRFTRLVQTI